VFISGCVGNGNAINSSQNSNISSQALSENVNNTVTQSNLSEVPLQNKSDAVIQPDGWIGELTTNLTSCPFVELYSINRHLELYDGKEYYDAVGYKGDKPSGILCRKGEKVGERTDMLYCDLYNCLKISENATVKGYAGILGFGEYSINNQKTNETHDGNNYTYTLTSCAQEIVFFDNKTACTYGDKYMVVKDMDLNNSP
jgi:hypothetical protein